MLLCSHHIAKEDSDKISIQSTRHSVSCRFRSAQALQIKPLTAAEVEGVETFVIFVGYPRSGHSFIGSVLDAHPNMIISHEYFLMKRCTEKIRFGENIFQDKFSLFNSLYKNSAVSSKCGWRSDKGTKKGYNLGISGLWQGSFSQLKIIGDKSGARTCIVINQDNGCLQLMSRTLNTSITAVHVVRNPYDMIATDISYKLTKMKGSSMLHRSINPSSRLQMNIARYIFNLSQAVVKVTKEIKLLEIHIEDYIKSPNTSLAKICSGFGVPCPKNYMEECYKKTYTTVARSRDNIEWDPAVLEFISEEMKKYPFFQGYTFENDYRI